MENSSEEEEDISDASQMEIKSEHEEQVPKLSTLMDKRFTKKIEKKK